MQLCKEFASIMTRKPNTPCIGFYEIKVCSDTARAVNFFSLESTQNFLSNGTNYEKVAICGGFGPFLAYLSSTIIYVKFYGFISDPFL